MKIKIDKGPSPRLYRRRHEDHSSVISIAVARASVPAFTELTSISAIAFAPIFAISAIPTIFARLRLHGAGTAANCRTASSTDGSPQNGAVLAAYALSDHSTCRPTQCAPQDSAAINRESACAG
jgi:hypothetical protein